MGKISEYLERNYTKYRNDVAVIARQQESYIEITNEELYESVNAVVYFLMPYVNQNIAIVGSNGLEWLLSFLSVLGYIGNAILIDREVEQEELNIIVQKVSPDLVILDDALKFEFKGVKTIKFHEISAIARTKEAHILKLDHQGKMFLHTSGTTGQPKVVCLGEAQLVAALPELNTNWRVTHLDSCFFIVPMNHIYALASLFHALYIGCTIVLESEYQRLEQALHHTHPTLFLGVPLIYQRIIKQLGMGNSRGFRVRILISRILLRLHIDLRKQLFSKIHHYFGDYIYFGSSAGSRLPVKISQLYLDVGIPVYNVYGMTETSGPIAFCYENNNPLDSVGRILNNNEVRIVHADRNGAGEIWVRGSNVFDGYIGEESQEELQDKYFNTGDIGYIKDGFLYVLGRRKDILIGDNGKNISPEELRKKLLHYKEIISCNIVMENNYLYADVETQLSQEKLHQIRNKINASLPNYKKISEIRAVDCVHVKKGYYENH